MPVPAAAKVQSVPIALIDVINPRARNRKVFREMLDSIAAIGLKRPITVAVRQGPQGLRYDLICGQGRLEAFRELGQVEIPAVVVDAETEDCLVMSLVENVARRQHQAIDLLHDIDGMRRRGHSDPEIARKTGLSLEYVRGVLRLLTGGETRLLRAVEAGQMPVSVAVEIAEAEDANVQRVLHEAYEKKLLRGHNLMSAKRLIEVRRSQGPRVKANERRRLRPLSVDSLLRTYRQDVDKKRMIVRDATNTRGMLLFVVEALRALRADEGFVNLLRAEGLYTMPAKLAERVGPAPGEA
ncbi:plasmid partitioning protein RepB C-terminal domain-containing protein [Neoroseomonas soli]|nr:plasmid partitioning protein RepB C-terminal domain-containing protein [Neoroseomonas soli]MBR0670754.1 ParB N-terminal domain-containing protein [Neoroseomonas soli]